MLFSNNDSFFDNLFFNNMERPKSRRISNKKPEDKVSKSLQPRRQFKPNRDELSLSLFIDDDLSGETEELNFLENTNKFFDTNNFFEHNKFDVKEDGDKYLVSYKDTDIINKELNVNYLKEQQQLVVSSKIKKCDKYDNDGNANSESVFFSTSEDRVKLSKPVIAENMKGTIENNCLKLCIPKLETDDYKDNEQKVITPAITENNETSD